MRATRSPRVSVALVGCTTKTPPIWPHKRVGSARAPKAGRPSATIKRCVHGTCKSGCATTRDPGQHPDHPRRPDCATRCCRRQSPPAASSVDDGNRLRRADLRGFGRRCQHLVGQLNANRLRLSLIIKTEQVGLHIGALPRGRAQFTVDDDLGHTHSVARRHVRYGVGVESCRDGQRPTSGDHRCPIALLPRYRPSRSGIRAERLPPGGRTVRLRPRTAQHRSIRRTCDGVAGQPVQSDAAPNVEHAYRIHRRRPGHGSARVETYMLAYHVQDTDDGVLLHTFNGRYIDRFEHRDGAWLIARRTLRNDWSRVEPLGEPMRGAWIASGRAGSPDPLND
jgi:hypothetical protein